jgi:hypothetical protein
VDAAHFSKMRGLLAVAVATITGSLAFALISVAMDVREAEHMAQFARRLVRR